MADYEYDDVDRDAFRRAIEQWRAEGPQAAADVDLELSRRSWEDAGEHAAYHRQCHALGLKPWETPPCVLDPDVPGHGTESEARGMLLLRRMLDAGLSQWEPDPLAALADAERATRRNSNRGK